MTGEFRYTASRGVRLEVATHGPVLQTAACHSMVPLLKLKPKWDKIPKHIQDQVGAESLFEANY